MVSLSFGAACMASSVAYTAVAGLHMLAQDALLGAFHVPAAAVGVIDRELLWTLGAWHLFAGGMYCIASRVTDARFRRGWVTVQLVAWAALEALLFFTPVGDAVPKETVYTTGAAGALGALPYLVLYFGRTGGGRGGDDPAERTRATAAPLYRLYVLLECLMAFGTGVTALFFQSEFAGMMGPAVSPTPMARWHMALFGLAVGVGASGCLCMLSGLRRGKDRRGYLCLRCTFFCILLVLRTHQMGLWDPAYSAALRAATGASVETYRNYALLDGLLAAPALYLLASGTYKGAKAQGRSKGGRDD